MSLLETLLHAEILLALTLFTTISIVVEISGYKFLTAAHEVEVTHWILKYILIPAARTLALASFILVAYPVLFGIEEAPIIIELLAAGHLRLTNLVNIIFLLSLVLPIIPIFSRWPALVLPIQGIIAATMVFNWLMEWFTEKWMGSHAANDIQYWPGWPIVISLLVLALLTHEIAKWVSHRLENKVDKAIDRDGSGKLIYRSVIMIMQAPVILIYTLSLGQQLQ